MKISKIVFLSILLANTFSCGINNPPINSENSTVINSPSANLYVNSAAPNGLELKIETSPDVYAPIMSSTVGILIKPVYKQEDMQNNKITFKTNHGFFVLWNPQVKNLGKEAIYDGNAIYWSYDIADKFSEATINLSVSNNKNEIIKSIDIKIKIDDKGFASVVNNQ